MINQQNNIILLWESKTRGPPLCFLPSLVGSHCTILSTSIRSAILHASTTSSMDPASIFGLAAACSSLTKLCAASVVKSLHGLVERSAELTILSVVAECETIQFAWRSIESQAEEHMHNVNDFEEIGERLQRSIYCGELVMSALEEKLLAITLSSSSLRRGLDLTLSNGVFNEHRDRICGQVASLQLLLQVMSLYADPSSACIKYTCRARKADRIEILPVNRKVFSESKRAL